MFAFADKRPFAVPIVIIDTETTGLIPAMGHRVIEVGAIRIEDGQEVGQLNTLLNPGRKIPADASQVNGIFDEDLAGQPPFADITSDLFSLVDGALLVAHHAAFDAAFLGMELFIDQFTNRRPAQALRNPWLCTLQLARAYFRFGRNNLGAVAQRLGVPVTQAHRALNDVHTTSGIFTQMVRECERQRLNTIGDLMYAQGGEIIAPAPLQFTLPEPLSLALANGQDLHIHYQSKTGSSSRKITPLYPTRFRNETYLIAYCHSRRDQRTFRLRRMKKMTLLD